MRGNPSGNFVPECEPRKGVNWRLSVFGCQNSPRRFSGQLRHLFTCPRLDLLYQSERSCARGESKKLRRSKTLHLPALKRRLRLTD